MKFLFIFLLISVFAEELLDDPENRRVFPGSQLVGNLQSFFQSDITKVLKDISNLEKKVPSKLLDRPRRLRNGVQVSDIRRNYVNAIIGYCKSQNILTIDCVCRKTFHDVSIFMDSAIDSVLVVAANVKLRKLVVSYRPAFSIRNWIANLNYPTVDLPGAPRGVKVHRGFYKYYTSLEKKSQGAMAKLLDNSKYKDYPLQLTGYSLGGGMSTIAIPGWVKFLSNRGDKRKLEVHALSGPRVGNQAYADYVSSLNVTVVRYTNNEDVVNHLPPRSFGFVHVGTEFYEHETDGNGSKIETCSEDYDEDPNCALSFKGLLSIRRHYYPFNAFAVLPPTCET